MSYASLLQRLMLAMPAMAETHYLVINNGRVIHPETKLDAIRNLGIRGRQDRGHQ